MTPHRPAADRRWILWLLVGWAVAAAVMLWVRWGNIQWFVLSDTDDNLRFAQVRDWLRGQGWFDLRQHHLDPPGGANIHWSRLVDLPIAGLILATRPFLGTIVANKVAVAIAPLLPMALAMLGGALTARRLIAPGAWLLAAALVLCGPNSLGMWMPLRIDHHGWQLALLMLTVAGVCDHKAARGGVTMGLATAASLTIGLEMLPYFGIATAAVTLRWVADPADGRRLIGYGASLAAGAALGYAGFASEANRLPLCDALSPVWLSDALIGGGLAVGIALLPLRDWRWRLAAALGVGVALGAFHATAWPQCLGRPENVSPELMRIWLGNVKEAKPIFAQDWRTALPMLGLPLSGLIGGIWATWAARGTQRLIPWGAVLLFGVAAAGLLLWQVRAAPAAQLLAVPGATMLAWAFVPRLADDRRRAVRLLATPLAFLIVSGLWIPTVMRALPAPPPRIKAGFRPGQPDRSRFCGSLPSLTPLAKLPPSIIFTFVDFAPRLIATTAHSSIAGPYHRNGAAILDVQHAFRGNDETAHAIIRRHRAAYLLTCPGLGESTIYASQAPNGFYSRLNRGETPAWLTPVELPKNSPLKLWRVTG